MINHETGVQSLGLEVNKDTMVVEVVDPDGIVGKHNSQKDKPLAEKILRGDVIQSVVDNEGIRVELDKRCSAGQTTTLKIKRIGIVVVVVSF